MGLGHGYVVPPFQTDPVRRAGPVTCLDLLEDADLAGCLWVVSIISSCKVSLTRPQKLLCSFSPLTFCRSCSSSWLSLRGGALENVVFVVVP